MSAYQGEYARLYDLFYGDKPYDNEAAFCDRLLREYARGASERLLDVACGTGQHAVRFAARGWEVVGVDQSADMLRQARERSTGDGVTFVEQDMRQLNLPVKSFDAAVCLFDSIGYAVTNEGVIGTLSGVRRHLRPGGLLVAEFWHAPPMLCHHEPVRVREWETPEGRVVRISRTAVDSVAQVARVEYSVYLVPTDGSYAIWSEVHENRFFLVQEMDLILRNAGFEPLEWNAGFEASGQIDESTWHVVVLARATGDNAR